MGYEAWFCETPGTLPFPLWSLVSSTFWNAVWARGMMVPVSIPPCEPSVWAHSIWKCFLVKYVLFSLTTIQLKSFPALRGFSLIFLVGIICGREEAKQSWKQGRLKVTPGPSSAYLAQVRISPLCVNPLSLSHLLHVSSERQRRGVPGQLAMWPRASHSAFWFVLFIYSFKTYTFWYNCRCTCNYKK